MSVVKRRRAEGRDIGDMLWSRMPELPDVTVYVERIAARFGGQRLERIRTRSPSLVRTADPPLSSIHGALLLECSRLGKRIVFGLEGDRYLVLHLMIAGRLHEKPLASPIPGKVGVAAFDFERSTLLLTEASSHKRAQLHLVIGQAGLEALKRGGLEVMTASEHEFARALLAENHTLKRALTDPRILSGIGNAYSDEILHRAQLSPIKLTSTLDDEELARLHAATREVLAEWTERLREQAGEGIPTKVTAFRPEMVAHGKYGKPCPRCGTKIQRIVYASNETNYCPTCQTGGRLLADRSLSRLLRGDWPKTLEELEEHKAARRLHKP